MKNAQVVFLCLLVMYALLLSGCDPEKMGDPTLDTVSIKPADSYTNPGSTVQFTVTAKYSDGASIDNWSPDGGFTWASNTTPAVTIDQNGLATGVDTGETTITAVHLLEDGSEISGSTTLTVLDDPTGVTISPSSASVDAGASVQLSATATFADASQTDVTAWADWSSDNQGIARVAADGQVTGISVGSTTIHASFETETDSITVTVTAPPENPDVVEAVAIAQANYALAIFIAAFGGTVDGLEVNMLTGEVTFTNFDITDWEMGYTTVSGTVSPTLDESINFDLSFTGGPISSLQFTLTSEQLEALDMEESVLVVAIADGEEYIVTLTPATVE